MGGVVPRGGVTRGWFSAVHNEHQGGPRSGPTAAPRPGRTSTWRARGPDDDDPQQQVSERLGGDRLDGASSVWLMPGDAEGHHHRDHPMTMQAMPRVTKPRRANVLGAPDPPLTRCRCGGAYAAGRNGARGRIPAGPPQAPCRFRPYPCPRLREPALTGIGPPAGPGAGPAGDRLVITTQSQPLPGATAESRRLITEIDRRRLRDCGRRTTRDPRCRAARPRDPSTPVRGR